MESPSVIFLNKKIDELNEISDYTATWGIDDFHFEKLKMIVYELYDSAIFPTRDMDNVRYMIHDLDLKSESYGVETEDEDFMDVHAEVFCMIAEWLKDHR
jgi:hypothetical protein